MRGKEVRLLDWLLKRLKVLWLRAMFSLLMLTNCLMPSFLSSTASMIWWHPDRMMMGWVLKLKLRLLSRMRIKRLTVGFGEGRLKMVAMLIRNLSFAMLRWWMGFLDKCKKNWRQATRMASGLVGLKLFWKLEMMNLRILCSFSWICLEYMIFE